MKNNILLSFTDIRDGNIAYHVRDDKSEVTKRHQQLARKYGYTLEKLVHMQQFHSDIVHIVNKDDNFDNPPKCDAIITNKLHTPLMVMVADCAPVLIHDLQNKAIAAVHAGRAGAFKNILAKTLHVMMRDFSCTKESLHVTIGPSIGLCCYEVGKEIAQQTDELGYSFAIKQEDEKYFLDIHSILQYQLDEIGIKNITISSTCNCCDANYFSYRRENKTGRFCGVIELR